MPRKRKEDFINDKRRVSYLHAVYNRIYRDQSVLIEGDYGVGKTRFLELIKPKKRKIIWVESLNNIPCLSGCCTHLYQPYSPCSG